jgi:hypothetical protein
VLAAHECFGYIGLRLSRTKWVQCERENTCCLDGLIW